MNLSQSIQRFMLSSFILLLIVGLTTATVTAEMVSDPEVEDLKARVLDVTWKEEPIFDEDPFDLDMQFNVSLEIWNPYDATVVSYGSSSCPWGVNVDPVSLQDTIDIIESSLICTADYGPNKFPSGLSQVNIFPNIHFENKTQHIAISHLPHGIYNVNGQGGNYSVSEDRFYGVQINASTDGFNLDFEPHPLNWGDILFHKTSGSHLSYEFYIIGLVPLIFVAIIKRSKFRKM